MLAQDLLRGVEVDAVLGGRADLGDLHFHDLRGTAVTRLALAGCTVPEIAAITGHSLKDVEAILDAHYLGGRFEPVGEAFKGSTITVPTGAADVPGLEAALKAHTPP